MAPEGAVGDAFFTEQKRENSNLLLRVLNILLCALDHDVAENLRTAQTVSSTKQSWEFYCLLPQDECHDLCIRSYICYGCISLYTTRGTDTVVLHTPKKVSSSLSQSHSTYGYTTPSGVRLCTFSTGKQWMSFSLCREDGPERQV